MRKGIVANDNKSDIFDILGISNREDSFTNLLAEVFNKINNKEFRDKFCKEVSNNNFQIYNSDDCTVCTRHTFNIALSEDTGSRSKVIPDMLLIAPSQKKVVVIENKIFSEEGYRQTEAYSSLNFVEELTRMLEHEYNIKGHLNIEFYYMTLLGEKASSSKFKSLKWYELIINTCTGIKFDSPFDILVADLISRAKELRDFIKSPINGSESFGCYCDNMRRWINYKVIARKYFDSILDKIHKAYNEEIEYSISIGGGRSAQLLIILSASNWKSNNLEEYNQDSIEVFKDTRNVHVEFTWHLGSTDASILLHYETYPYYPQNKLKERFPEIEPYFNLKRQEFKRYIKNDIEVSKYWEIANTKLAFAKLKCRDFKEMPFREFEELFLKAFDEAYHIINDILEKK